MSHDATQHTSVRTYLLVFGGLSILTALTVALSYAGLSHKAAIVAAVLIASTKCTLIGAFFMHLRDGSRVIFSVLLTAAFFIAFLIGSLIADIGVAVH